MPVADLPPLPVGIGLREFRVTVYRPRVPAGGVVELKLRNFGEDDHNLQAFGPRGFRSRVSPDVEPGGTASLRLRLVRPGAYRLVCVKPGHPALGMRATLRVRARGGTFGSHPD